MSKNFVRILCLIMATVLVVGLLAGLLATVASAAATTYQLVDLLAEGKIKPLGRTQTNLAGDAITADWSGSGFDINVSGDGGTMTIGYKANYSAYWAVLVDGEQVWRGQTASSSTGSTFSVTIPSGEHTVRVVKETQMSSSETGYSYLTTLDFAGTIETAPANRSLYIEFVGDSITCGDGALGEYEPGVKWLGAHDSATHSYAYYAARKLGADYSLVARGGIGLFTGISEAEGTTQKKGMQDIYNYVSAYNTTSNGEYSFSRQPQVVFIELGANDGIDASDQYKTIEYWQSLMEDFVDQVRSKNPNAHIVLHGRNAQKLDALMNIVEARKESDPKLHLFYGGWLGNGSAALATQYAGHPSGEDAEAFATQVVNYLRYADLVPAYESKPSYTDITYYISASGSDSNAGTSADAPLLTLPKAFTLAAANSGEYATGSRIVFQVSGAVVATNSQEFGGYKGTGIKDTAGGNVPVLITTKDYSAATDNRAELKLMNATTADNAATIIATNDITFQNVLLKSYTATSKPLSVRHFYAAGHHVVFDNTNFISSDGKKWQISVDHFTTACINICNSTPESPVNASITFKNGDYTDLDRVCVIKKPDIYNGTASAPGLYAKLIIEDGAKMGTVYNRYGTLDVGKAEVIINGGSVQQYVGTADGSSSARKTYKGDINLTVNGGEIYGTHFSTTGNYATVEGDINTTITGGDFRITPESTDHKFDGYFFGGRRNAVVENINTTISGGQFYALFEVEGVDSGYYFAVADGGSTQNVTTKISGGVFFPVARGAAPVHMGFFLGAYSGNITGTNHNEITGGIFDAREAGVKANVICGSRGVNWATGKQINVIGRKGTEQGPQIYGAALQLGGGWAQIGTDTRSTTASPATTDCTDTVVLSNTIYGGSFGNVYLAPTGKTSTTSNYYSFVKGSVESNVYGGFFQGTVYGAGNGEIFGHVTTNVYSGYFRSIYGGQENRSMAYDGVELNIYGMDEYYPVNPNDTWVFCGGNASGSVPVPMTADRDAIELNIAPSSANELTLNTRVKVGDTDGTTSVSVKRGTFPRGFAVEGTTVGGALASGSTVFDASTGTKATFATGDSSVSGSVVVDSDGESYTNELVYYVSENGQDAYSGTSPATPKKTLRAAFSEVIADNGGKSKFPVGTTLTIYVEGAVNNDAGTGSQQLGGGQVLTMTDIHDHVPVTITTYNYNGKDKAVIVDNHYAANGGNASTYVVNDLCFKDIDLQSITNPSTGYADTNFYAAGCSVTFDNCTITTDGKATEGGNSWKINADHFSTGGFNPLNTAFYPHKGTVTFKNGDYTNLSRVSAVGANSIWRSSGSVYSIPDMSTKVIIEDGAKMGTVYNAYGTLGVGSATVEIRGGTVEKLLVTNSGTSNTVKTYNTNLTTVISGGTVASYTGSGDYVTINGNVTHTVSGGTVNGETFYALGNNATLNGNLTNNLTSGKIIINPTSTANGGHGIFLSGRDNVQITGNVENNISGGDLGVEFKVTNIQSGIWFGLRSGGKVTGNVTNNITGGNIYTKNTAGNVAAKYASIHLGCFSGSVITGTLTNNISGGTFEMAKGSYYFGQQGVSGSTGKVVNVLGDQATGEGPTFKGTNSIILAGGWGRLGVTSNVGTLPAESAVTDTVVVSNTIYGGTYGGPVTAGLNNAVNTEENYVTYIKGSVKNDIYGGKFTTFYGNGDAPTYGKVTTNIYGGTFDAVYGNRKAIVYDGVELNIYGMTEGTNPTGIWAAGTTPTVSTVTEGRDAVKLTIDPEDTLTLSMPISAGSSGSGTVTGTTSVLVTGGTYTNGFAVSGVKVKEALADGLVPLKDADKTVVKVTDDMTTTGTDSVTLVSGAWTEDSTELTLSDTSVTWDGNTDAKVPTTTVKFENSTLVKDTDYTVSYQRDGAATTDLNSLGTVTVVVTAKAPYSGSVSAVYTITRAGAVADAIKEVTDAVNGYDVDTVKSSDSADLTALTADINKILTDHAQVLTDSEKQDLQGLLTTVDTLADKIDAVADALADARTETAKFDAASVTADDADKLTALAADIAAIPDGNLTDAEKAEKKALADEVKALQKVITDTGAALADVKAEAEKIDNATVTADDEGDLTALAAEIAAIPDGNLTSAQKADKKAAADKVAAAQKVITDTAKALDDAKAEAAKINGNTVNSDDAETLTALAAEIAAIPDGNLTAAQKAEKQGLTIKVETLQQIIADTAADLKALQEKEAAFKTEELTSADKAGLQALLQDLQQYPTDHLTAGEKELLEQLAARVQDKIAVIEKAEQIAGDIGAIEALLDGKTTANVTSEDSTDVMAAQKAIEQLKKDESLTAADKQKLTQLESEADSLAAQLEKAEAAAQVPEAVQNVKPENVKPDDKAALEEAIAQLEQAEEDFAGNYTEAEKKAIAEDKAELEAALAVIEEVEAVQKQIADLPATAEPDDEKTIADLDAARAAYGELNERQKGMITDAELEKLDKLAASLKDYKITAGNKAEWTQKSGKDLSFTANGLFAKFEGVQVDGTTVDSKYYTAKSGSTVITLTDEFLDSLAKGEHSVKVVFADGSAIGTFTVKAKAASPATGDEANLALFGLLAIFSVAAAAAVVIGMKKREQ